MALSEAGATRETGLVSRSVVLSTTSVVRSVVAPSRIATSSCIFRQ